jgi:hypothetical protein
MVISCENDTELSRSPNAGDFLAASLTTQGLQFKKLDGIFAIDSKGF